jgi:septal ring factor EnvC (AmiA/AmiB activator)
MALFDKLKEELDRAGKAAQGAFDEGKIRLEAFRTRQLADKAAQALGYAVFRAKQSGSEVDADTYARLSATLATHDAEAARYESELDRKRKESAADRAARATESAASDTASATTASSSTSADSGTSSSTTGGASPESETPPPPSAS